MYYNEKIHIKEVEINSRFETIGIELRDMLLVCCYNPGGSTIQPNDMKDIMELYLKTIIIQGSTLSPILFLFYINDIPENIQTKIKLFADDTAISAESMNQDKVIDYVQKHLNELSTYYKKWQLKVNPENSTAVVFNNRRQTPKFKLKYDNVRIPYDTVVKYLGVKLDKRLNFNKHIEMI